MGRLGQVNIIVNGDSFTEEGHFNTINKDNTEKTWAHNIGAVNLAKGGCSNERIFYTTIDYLNSNDPDVLIIGWTDFSRYMIPHIDGFDVHISANGVANELGYGHKDNENALEEYGDFYFRKMHNLFLNFKRFLTYYQHLEKYCSVKKIKFLNFMSITELPRGKSLHNISRMAPMSREDKDTEQQGIVFNANKLEAQLNKFKEANWINNKVGFCYSDQVKHMPKWHDGHPGLEASKEWTKIIKDNLTT